MSTTANVIGGIGVGVGVLGALMGGSGGAAGLNVIHLYAVLCFQLTVFTSTGYDVKYAKRCSNQFIWWKY